MEFMQAGVSVIQPFINLFGNYLWDAKPNLTDRNGKEFISDYLPKNLTLEAVIHEKQRHFPFSSSDISRYVEIAIQKAINDGRSTPEGGVYLDFIGCDLETILADKSRSIARMWPTTYEWYKARGTDLYKDKVQITCSAHAINGGLRIDSNAESNIKGLFAAGEVAAGPHGADRLGGNMSVTCQVFGGRAGRAAAARATARDHLALRPNDKRETALTSKFSRNGTVTLATLRQQLQQAANRHLLILRDEVGLRHFRNHCLVLNDALTNMARIETPEDLLRAVELRNLITVGDLMALAALNRRESRGSHFREDHPESRSDLDRNIILTNAEREGFFWAKLGEL
jgi:L-aspartate oxidase